MSYFWLLLGFLAGVLITTFALSGARRLEPGSKRGGPHKKAIDAALARLAAGHHTAAAASLRQATELQSGDDAIYLLLGEELRRAGDASRAERVAEILLARRDLAGELRSAAWLLKGRLLEGAQREDEALAAYAKAVDSDTKELAPLIAQGRLFSRLRRWEEAIRVGEAVTRLDPERGRLITARRRALAAREYVAEGRAKDALREARRAVEAEPQLAAAQMSLGDAHLQLGEPRKARESWHEAAKRAPWLAPAVLERLEYLARASGERESVRRFAKDCASREGEDTPPWRIFAWLVDEALRLDAIEEARGWCEKLERAAPLTATTARLRARLAACEDGSHAGPRLLALLARWENDPVWIDPWVCRVCGHQPEQLEWRCSKCQAWESLR